MAKETERELRGSFDLEGRADLLAASGSFREASDLMRRANKIRRSHFGSLEPNELRERAAAALTQESTNNGR